MLVNLSALAHLQRRMERIEPTETGCRPWPGALNNKGYGKLSVWRTGTFLTHRLAYGMAHGWVPAELDHLCRNKRCLEVSHLEPVTHPENCARAGNVATEFCERGHRWDEVGWYTNSKGRKCKACHRIIARESARRRKGDPGQTLSLPMDPGG